MNYIYYPGNKNKYIPILSKLIKPFFDKHSTFIEPFGGSGAMSLYMSKYMNVILNEKNDQVFKIHESFKYGSEVELVSIINEIWSYGNPKDIKEDYYKARTDLNEKYFNKSNFKSGFYNWAISTFAINSMMRFGPNGFNQGWGNRGIENSDEFTKFNDIKNAYANITLHNLDYKILLDGLDTTDNSIIFLDPPYVDKGSGTYSFNDAQFNEFVNIIKDLNCPIIYTDTFSYERLNKLGKNWNFEILRSNLGSGKPGKSNSDKVKEVVYYNFDKVHTGLF